MPANEERIKQLRGFSKLLLLMGIPLFVYLLFFYKPSQIPEEMQEATRVSTTDLAEGDHKRVSWKGRQLIVLRRSAAMLSSVQAFENAALYDPDSRLSRQPDYAQNIWRFSDPEWLVVIDQSPDTGCSVELIVDGFRDPCRGSLYDWSGRVLEGQPSKRNLEVPGHRVGEESIYIYSN